MSPEIRVGPLSDLQRDWWFREHRFRNPDLVISTQLNVDGAVDEAALSWAVGQLMERHESLRTNFVGSGERTAQVIWPAAGEPPLFVEDLSELADAETARKVDEIVRRESVRLFDFSAEPLLRVVLIKTAADHCVLSITVHHIVADAWAFSLIGRELAVLYEARRDGRTSTGLAAPMQLREWVALERERNAGEAVTTQLRYWEEVLAAVPPVRLPPDREPTDPLHFVSAEHRFVVPGPTAAGLDAAALLRRYRATPLVVGLTAFLQLLAARAHTTQAAAVTLLHRRTSPGVESLVGCINNALTINVDVRPDDDPADLVVRVRDRVVQAHANQDVFVTRIWERTKVGPGDVDALFIYDKLGPPLTAFGRHPARIRPPSRPRSFERYGPWWENLKLRLQEGEDGVWGVIEYNAEMYDAATIADVGREYLDILGALCAKPA